MRPQFFWPAHPHVVPPDQPAAASSIFQFVVTVRSGASGYTLKVTSAGELIAAIRDGYFSLENRSLALG
jgi:hypothetical protein